MTDMGYGVYVRIQNTDGALFSSSREEWAETRTDLVTAFGEEFADALVGSLRRVLVKNTAQVVKLPAQAPATVEVQVDEAAALQLAEDMLVATGTDDEPESAPQFEACAICGTPKDQWKPPGVAASGKKYPGFFGCPNFRNHPKK